MKIWPALWLVAAAIVPGCVTHDPATGPAAPSDACDQPDVSSVNESLRSHYPPTLPSFNGTGTFQLRPSPPVLTPGVEQAFNASFYNPDCHNFIYTSPMDDCGNSVIRIGARPLLLYGHEPNASLALLAVHSCGATVTAKAFAIGQGETYSLETHWNGSFRFWDHSFIERGEPWGQRTYWAAAGAWPVSYGFDEVASYPVARDATLTVQENDLNRQGGLHPDGCRMLDRAQASLTNVELSASPVRAPLGTNITFYANYTIQLPSPGCYLFFGGPVLHVKDIQGRWTHGSGSAPSAGGIISPCAYYPHDVLVQASTTQVTGHLVHQWDGRSVSPLACGEAAQRGTANVTFFEGGLPHPTARPTTTIEWT